jgi:hypothetical protein
MVKSRINSEKVTYNESQGIDDEDLDYSSPLFNYKLYKHDIIIGLGKQRDTYTRYNIIFFPVYLITDETVRAKIGVVEVEMNKLDDILDEAGDVKVSKKNLVFFVDKSGLESLLEKYQEDKLGKEEEEKDKKEEKEKDKTEEKKKEKDNEVHLSDDEDFEDLSKEDDVLELKVPEGKQTTSDKETKAALKDGVFTINEKTKGPPSLKEETKEEAKELKEKFTESPNDIWISKLMKNENYDIIDNEGGGDCFFAVIRDAFKQIGKETTVAKLRALLAREATDALFQESRSIYTAILGDLQETKKKIKEASKTITLLKKRIQSGKNKEENEKLLEQAKDVLADKKRLDVEEKETKGLMHEFDYMEPLTTLEKFREFMLTRDYWADTWSISTMEKLLNVKFIILSKQSFQSCDYDSVMQCGQLNDDELERAGTFVPEFYIMTSYESGNHYKTVSYKEKRIFKFREVPYDIKIMIINKCLEKNSGPYYLIQDFRNLKTSLGLHPDEGAPEENEDEYLTRDLYDKSIVFAFHGKAAAPKPGRGSGESIKKEDMVKFKVLNSIEDWRRKLDDSWIKPFELDCHRWNSVEHFYLGSQFRKGFPDFYKMFAVESGTDISKDLDVARAAISKSGKLKGRVVRDSKIKIDPDFFSQGEDPIFEVVRRKALLAKFSGNQELKNILLETMPAKLVHFERSKGNTADIMLMQVRKKLYEAEAK